jgi:spore maturation protein CgeB
MPSELRITYIAHSLRSDWNNGNAHFLRGLMRSLVALGHQVTILEPANAWSIENLSGELLGERSLADFHSLYPDLNIETYSPDETDDQWRDRINSAEIVILHEWNPPALAQSLLKLRDKLGFRLLFHDTHHRASSSPEQMRQFSLDRFDGILAFGEALRTIYRERFNIARVWILHEAADTSIFHPISTRRCDTDAVWIGNWGDGERSAEIREFYLNPAAALANTVRFTVYGVRYPDDGIEALRSSGVHYGGYLPNLDAPAIYASAKLTVHIPRQQYNTAMTGIPTIRVFEALACGIPLISAPWQDTESLFRPGDLRFVHNGCEMKEAVQELLGNARLAAEQSRLGLETVLARHTCAHRAQELTQICKELLS